MTCVIDNFQFHFLSTQTWPAIRKSKFSAQHNGLIQAFKNWARLRRDAVFIATLVGLALFLHPAGITD